MAGARAGSLPPALSKPAVIGLAAVATDPRGALVETSPGRRQPEPPARRSRGPGRVRLPAWWGSPARRRLRPARWRVEPLGAVIGRVCRGGLPSPWTRGVRSLPQDAVDDVANHADHDHPDQDREMDRQQQAGDDHPPEKQPDPLDPRPPGIASQPVTVVVSTVSPRHAVVFRVSVDPVVEFTVSAGPAMEFIAGVRRAIVFAVRAGPAVKFHVRAAPAVVVTVIHGPAIVVTASAGPAIVLAVSSGPAVVFTVSSGPAIHWPQRSFLPCAAHSVVQPCHITGAGGEPQTGRTHALIGRWLQLASEHRGQRSELGCTLAGCGLRPRALAGSRLAGTTSARAAAAPSARPG